MISEIISVKAGENCFCIFLCEDKEIGRFSYLHECTLKNLLLVTVVALFTAKMTNPEKTIHFISLVSCSISKLKSQMLFTCKNFVCRFYVEKKVLMTGSAIHTPN